jgi:hypothetical protein
VVREKREGWKSYDHVRLLLYIVGGGGRFPIAEEGLDGGKALAVDSAGASAEECPNPAGGGGDKAVGDT